MELEKIIRFVATDSDKELLQRIAQSDGDASMSATLRRLIRAEASRRGLDETPSMPVLRTSVVPRDEPVREAEG